MNILLNRVSTLMVVAIATCMNPILHGSNSNCGVDEDSKNPRQSCDLNLPGYSFKSHYLAIEDSGLKMHYLDEGPQQGRVVLLVHGEPYWSYGFRNFVEPLVRKGYRVIIPDMVGFGMSDKLDSVEDYSYSAQCVWMEEFIKELCITNIHLFAHDWGGMVMLRLVANNPHLFSKVIISYATLFTGEIPMPASFGDWKSFAKTHPDFNPGTVMNWGTNRELSPETIAAYNYPYQKPEDLLALRIFPSLIPENPENPEARLNRLSLEKLSSFHQPFLTVWGDHNDDLWTGLDHEIRKYVPGATGQNHQILQSNHFIIEDQTDALIDIMLKFFDE